MVSGAKRSKQIPMTRAALPPELFGVWMMLSSLLGFFVFTDLGIGNAVLNKQIDMLWQYTGTELTDPGYLNLTSGVPTDLDQAFQLVKQKDEPRGLCWVAPAPMDDTPTTGMIKGNCPMCSSREYVG